MGQTPDHPLFNGSTTVGIVSAENPRFPGQMSGHEALGAQIQNMGLKGESRDGRYGAPEKAWMVYGPTREQMYSLGRQFGQETVVYSSGGQHELMYTNGPNAGRYHPALGHEFFEKEPEDYYTNMPELGGYLRLNFDWDKINPSNLNQEGAPVALGDRASFTKSEDLRELALELDEPIHTVEDIRKAVLAQLKKSYEQIDHIDPPATPHPHAYDWHNEHTDHHLQVAAPGVVLRSESGNLEKANADEDDRSCLVCGHQRSKHWMRDSDYEPDLIWGCNVEGCKSQKHEFKPKDIPDLDDGLRKDERPTGVSAYAKYAMPFGILQQGQATDLNHYSYHGRNGEIDKLVADHGYKPYYAGGKYGRPDLANRNYNTKHLMIYDPGHRAGGHVGIEAYTDAWRKLHELAHVLTVPDVTKLYGEGRRVGRLGDHRSLNEALRSVHWEWLAAHKQRELSERLGIHIPEHVFNKELNTIMHDAVHRVVTGKVVEPSGEGFKPHEHKVPLETALGMVREAAHNLGITGMHDLIQKSEGKAMAEEKQYDEREWRQALADAIRTKVDNYSKEMLALRQRELKKALPAESPAPAMTPVDLCPLCHEEDMPGKCKCLQGPLAPMQKSEKIKPTDKHPYGKCPHCQKPVEPHGTTCVHCKKEYTTSAKKNESAIDKNCGSPVMDKPGRPGAVNKTLPLQVSEKNEAVMKSDEKHTYKPVKQPLGGSSSSVKAHGSGECEICGNKSWHKLHGPADHDKPDNEVPVMHPTEKAELSTKPKEPIKAAPGNSIKHKKSMRLAKITMAPAGGSKTAPGVGLQETPKPTGGVQLPKINKPPTAGLPGAKPGAAPAAPKAGVGLQETPLPQGGVKLPGVSHLKSPPGMAGKPRIGILPVGSKPTPMPKAPGAATMKAEMTPGGKACPDCGSSRLKPGSVSLNGKSLSVLECQDCGAWKSNDPFFNHDAVYDNGNVPDQAPARPTLQEAVAPAKPALEGIPGGAAVSAPRQGHLKIVKSEDLGTCAFCKKTEHSGSCA